MSLIDRRRFITQMAATVGGLMLPIRHVPGFANTASGQLKRRHLVNMIGSGGWDSSWFHNTFSANALTGVSGAFVSTQLGGFEYEQQNATYKFTQKCTDNSENQLTQHPNYGPDCLFGPGMKWVFQDADYHDFLIWKGLIPAGSHFIGNNLILQGNTSTYALSFSSLISQALADQYARPLHYVLMADSPPDLWTNFAMAKSFGVPVCIPDITQFQQLTQVDPAEVPSSAIRDLIAGAIQGLTSQALGAHVKMKGSKAFTDGFRASFDGAGRIYGSNFTQAPEFKYLLKRYLMAMGRAFANMLADPAYNVRGAAFPIWFSGGDETFGSNWISLYGSYTSRMQEMVTQYQALAPLPAYADFKANPSAYAASIGDVANLTAGFWPRSLNQAYWYALADYLVRNDLSAVVDIPAWTGLRGGIFTTDMHVAYMEEIINVTATLACYREMMKSFQEVPLDQGGTLFDATMIALHTEFDRYVYHNGKTLQEKNTSVHVGTNHGETASILLAGYGIQRGKVIGGMHQGPNVHAAYSQGYDDNWYYLRPLPIDVNTGQPATLAAGGKRISTLAIFPTIMAAYGVDIPVQQVTDWNAIPCVIKT